MFKKFLATLLALFAAAAFAAVDVNKADQAQLDSIKGIGPGIAGKILDERKKGAFKDWTDLVDRVKGVGENNAAKFSEAGLTVNGATFKGMAAAPAAAAKPAPAAVPAPTAAPGAVAPAKVAAPAVVAAPAAVAKVEEKKVMTAEDKKAVAKKEKEEMAMAKKKEKEDKAAAKKAKTETKADAKSEKPMAADGKASAPAAKK